MNRILLLPLLACTVLSVLANDSLENILRSASGVQRAEVLQQSAYTHFEIDKQKGFASIYEAISIQKAAGNTVQLTEAENVLAVLHQRNSNYDSALFYYKLALDHIENPVALAKVFDNMGVIYKQLAKYDSALYFHQNARKLQSTTGQTAGVAYSLNNIGSVYLKKNDYEHAIEYYEKSLQIRKDLKLPSEIASSYLNIGRVYTQMNEYEKAQSYLIQALDIQKQQGNNDQYANTLNSLGNFYLQLKIYDKAREYYNKALHANELLGNKAGIASAYNNIGTVHRNLFNYEKALEYYNLALQIRRAEGLLSAEAYSLNNIGGLYWYKKEYTEAIKYYLLALEQRQKLGNKILIAHSFKSLGMVHKDKGDHAHALELYEKALESFTEERDLPSIASIQNLKGNLFRKLEDFAKALEFYTTAVEIYKQISDVEGVAYASNNIGLTYLHWGKKNEAVPFLETALNNAVQIMDKNLEKEVALSLAELYKSQHDFEKGLSYFERYSALKDSLLATESSKRIAEIEFENDLTVKDHEIAKQQFSLEKKDEKIWYQRMVMTLGVILLLGIGFFSVKYYKKNMELNDSNEELESGKVRLQEMYDSLEKKRNDLAEMNEKVTDSIQYAKKIQDAILPGVERFQQMLGDSFIFYEPRDIVSGDFYWIHEQDGKTFVVAADCTGHGVPGAFMSMIGNTLLNEIVRSKQVTDPAQILTEMDKGVISALRQDTPYIAKQEDGMEMSLCVIDRANGRIEFAGTDQKIYIVNDTGIQSYSGNIFPVGGMYKIKQRKKIPYETHILPIEKGMSLYMLSDGFVDQFGGEEDQRYTSNRLQKLLTENRDLDMAEQFLLFRRTFEEWKGTGRQIDDVLVVGIQF